MATKALEKIRIGISPITGKPHIFRHGAKPNLALEKKMVEQEFLQTLVGYMFHGSPEEKGFQMDFCLGDQWYNVSVKKIDRP